MLLNFCRPLNANGASVIYLCTVTNVIVKIHYEIDWIQNHHGNRASCMYVCIFTNGLTEERWLNLEVLSPGLHTEEKVSCTPAFVTFCFPTAESMWPAASCSYCHVFLPCHGGLGPPCVNQTEFFLKLYEEFTGIMSQEWEKWLTLEYH